MRRSLEGLNPKMIRKDNYPGLPEELKEFNYYIVDCGHSIMAIPECLLKRAEHDGDLDMYECPFPCKYVLSDGYKIYKSHVICDGEYNDTFGLVIDDKWYEY